MAILCLCHQKIIHLCKFQPLGRDSPHCLDDRPRQRFNPHDPRGSKLRDRRHSMASDKRSQSQQPKLQLFSNLTTSIILSHTLFSTSINPLSCLLDRPKYVQKDLPRTSHVNGGVQVYRLPERRPPLYEVRGKRPKLRHVLDGPPAGAPDHGGQVPEGAEHPRVR